MLYKAALGLPRFQAEAEQLCCPQLAMNLVQHYLSLIVLGGRPCRSGSPRSQTSACGARKTAQLHCAPFPTRFRMVSQTTGIKELRRRMILCGKLTRKTAAPTSL